MKRSLKLIAATMVLSLSISGIVNAKRVEFTDVSSHWAKEAIKWGIEQGAVNGYADGTFKPNASINEAEFMSMFLRAFGAEIAKSDGNWSEPVYETAKSLNYPVLGAKDNAIRNQPILRSQVAEIIAGANGEDLSGDKAITYLLNQGYTSGKTAATVEGYAGGDSLSRAEAIQFIKTLSSKGFTKLQVRPEATKTLDLAITVEDIAIGDSESSVISKLGEPARKDASENTFTWYVYNKDYAHYVQVGIQNGRVVALYTGANNWTSTKGVSPSSTRSEVNQANQNEQSLRDQEEIASYGIENMRVTYYFDQHDNGKIQGILLIDQTIAGKGNGTGSESGLADTVRTSFEKQVFDLSNVARVKQGKVAFEWDDAAALSARKHSEDMVTQGYFDHTNKQGQSPFDRMKAAGISYSYAAENIAAGQSNAIEVVNGWLNSSGHRKNILGDVKRLGVGVAFGGSMNLYYTQNFYTAR